jgi:hypothetical protein
VPVAGGPESDHRIVDVKRCEPIQPDDSVALVEYIGERFARPNLVAGCE